MKLFITGATGFIGSYLVSKLVDTEHEIHCLVRASSNYSILLNNNIHVILGDVTRKDTLLKGMRGCDVVVNLANIYSFWEPDISIFEKVNIQGTRNVMEAALENNIEKVVHISTYAIYENPVEEPYSEDTSFSPPVKSVYTKSKYAGDRIAWDFYKSRGLPLVVLYPANVIGIGDDKATGQYIDSFIKRRYPVRVCEKSIQTFVYVVDVAEAIVRAVEKEGNIGEKYLIGKEQLSYAEFNKIISRLSGVSAPFFRLPDFMTKITAALMTFTASPTGKAPRWGLSLDQIRTATSSFRCDGSKAEKELGISYTAVADVLKQVVEYKKVD